MISVEKIQDLMAQIQELMEQDSGAHGTDSGAYGMQSQCLNFKIQKSGPRVSYITHTSK